jgi:hypothetical protein
MKQLAAFVCVIAASDDAHTYALDRVDTNRSASWKGMNWRRDREAVYIYLLKYWADF